MKFLLAAIRQGKQGPKRESIWGGVTGREEIEAEG